MGFKFIHKHPKKRTQEIGDFPIGSKIRVRRGTYKDQIFTVAENDWGTVKVNEIERTFRKINVEIASQKRIPRPKEPLSEA